MQKRKLKGMRVKLLIEEAITTSPAEVVDMSIKGNFLDRKKRSLEENISTQNEGDEKLVLKLAPPRGLKKVKVIVSTKAILIKNDLQTGKKIGIEINIKDEKKILNSEILEEKIKFEKVVDLNSELEFEFVGSIISQDKISLSNYEVDNEDEINIRLGSIL